MTAPAPELDPLDPRHDAEWSTLVQWWESLPHGRRRLLSGLTPGEPLPQSTAAELHRLGVRCPFVLVRERNRLVRRSLPSSTVLEFLHLTP